MKKYSQIKFGEQANKIYIFVLSRVILLFIKDVFLILNHC